MNRALGGCLGLVLAFAPLHAAESSSAYEAVVAPILRARCIECHGETKQKAKLALHTWEGLVRGSDAGPVFVAGKPTESPLIARLKLPLDDEEHMPPQDHPQPTAEEISLLAHWVAGGASRTATLAELKLSPELAAAAAELPAKLAAVARPHKAPEAPWSFDPAAVEERRRPLAAKVAALQRRFPGALSYESRTSERLHFTAAGLGRDFGDAEFAMLGDVAAQVVAVDVSRTSITDRSAPGMSRFAQLQVFRAGSTEIGDRFVAALAALPRLEHLALPETKVSAACVAPLTRMSTLRVLRVAGTEAERPAQAANLPVTPSAADLLPAADTGK